MREGDGVVLAVSLQRALGDPGAVAVEAGEAPDVHGPKIQGGFALHHPFGQNPSRTAPAGDAKGVETRPHIHVRAFRRRAEDEVAVRREAFRAVDHLLDADLGQRGDAGDGLFQMLAEMIVIVVKQPELPVLGDVTGDPALRVRLVAAHDQTADLFLEVGATVRIAQGRRIEGKAGDLLGHDVLVLHGVQRHRHPGHRADLPGPHATAVHDRLAGDVAFGGLDMGDPVAVDPEAGDPDAFDDLCPMHPRAFGEALRDVRRACLPVRGQPGGTDQVRGVHQWPHPLDLVRADQLHLHAEAFRRRGQSLEFRPAVGRGGQTQAAGHFPAGIQARHGGQALVEVDRILQHLGDRGRGAQLADKACRMPGRPRGHLSLLQQDHVGLVVARKVVGRRAADDPAADDNDLSLCRKCHFRASLLASAGPKACRGPRLSATG